MQTVLGTMLRFRYPVLYERETITYSDGGQVATQCCSTCTPFQVACTRLCAGGAGLGLGPK